MANTKQKKKKGGSVQDLIGIKTFTKYGLKTNRGELLLMSFKKSLRKYPITRKRRTKQSVQKNQLKSLRNPVTSLPCSKGTQTVLAGYVYPKQISIIP